MSVVKTVQIKLTAKTVRMINGTKSKKYLIFSFVKMLVVSVACDVAG